LNISDLSFLGLQCEAVVSDARAQLTEVEAEHSELRRDIARLQEELAQRHSQEEFLGAIAKWNLLSTGFLWDVQQRLAARLALFESVVIPSVGFCQAASSKIRGRK
jgi:septal ring factor EnvC (AmiA/AmiB activator)